MGALLQHAYVVANQTALSSLTACTHPIHPAMKKTHPFGLLLTCLLASLGAHAQNAQGPAVVAAAGQTFVAHGLVLDWTVGEVAVMAWQPAGSQAQVLEGFHRGAWSPAELPDVTADALAVYPNPFKTDVWVQVSPMAEAIQVEVYDLQGRQLRAFTQKPEAGRVRLNLAELPMAGYMLSVFDPVSRKRTSHLISKND